MMKPGSINQSPWYECSQCCGEVCFPASMLRVHNGEAWCYECYDANRFDGEEYNGLEWHDLPEFIPPHEVELAKLRAVLEAAKNALPHINDVTNAAYDAEQRLRQAIEAAEAGEKTMICTECHCTIQDDYRGACVTCLRRENARLQASVEQLRNERDLFIAMVADVRNAERSRSMGVRGGGDKANWFDTQAVHDALSGIGPFSMKLAAEAGEESSDANNHPARSRTPEKLNH